MMTKLTLERTLLYRSDNGELTRYEIFKTDGNPANNIDSIIVYREKVVSGEKIWVRTSDHISLDHLGFSKNGGPQRAVGGYLRASRDISSAVEECDQHWSKNYA
jgi:hypothetical protein